MGASVKGRRPVGARKAGCLAGGRGGWASVLAA